MRLNTAPAVPDVRTAEGAVAVRLSSLKALRRLTLTALLWEDTFYAKGAAIADQIALLVPLCEPSAVAALAVEARDTMYLRHVPLFLVRELARHGNGTLVAQTLQHVVQRPDEMGEYLAMYWRGQSDAEKSPLSAGSKRGLARAFRKFNAYTLAKYDRDAAVKLRDVLRLTHAKPLTSEQAALWKQVTARTLPTPDTWEVALSAGADKRATFERLLQERKLGGLAFLRNLRNMLAANVNPALIQERFDDAFNKVLPFRFIAAAKHAPRFEADIERAMLRATVDLPKLAGTTALIVDVSGSMDRPVSQKSEMSRLDVAAALAVLVREQAEDAVLIATAGSDARRVHQTEELPARRGMALRDAVRRASETLGGGGIFLTQCLNAARQIVGRDVTRVIVLTDEQDCDVVARPGDAKPFGARNYLVNISNEKNGVGYGTQWTAHIDGWSEHVLTFIAALESEERTQ